MNGHTRSWVSLLVAVSIIVVLFVTTAQAHTSEELDLWIDEWMIQADEALSPDLVMLYQNMVELHPYYFNPEPFAPQRINWGGTVEEWRPLVAGHFSADKVETAMCLIHYETGGTGDPNIKNRQGSSAAGLFQFLKSTWDNVVPRSVTGGSYSSGQVYQPEANVRAAAWLQGAAGWGQWSPWGRGLCRGL
jgi:hypothetical protein